MSMSVGMEWTGGGNVLFVRSLIRDTVLLKPQFIGADYRDVILSQLQGRYDGACNSHGYVQSGSISIHKVSLGRVEAVSLNGDVSYDVQYFAGVCNPAVGSRLPVRVINMNKFGILAHGGVQAPDGSFVPVVEAIITRHLNSVAASDVNLDTVQVGDTVTIEILGKKFELFERKIAVVARIVSDDGASVHAHAQAQAQAADVLASEMGALSLRSAAEPDDETHSVIGSVEGENERPDHRDNMSDGDGADSASDGESSRGGGGDSTTGSSDDGGMSDEAESDVDDSDGGSSTGSSDGASDLSGSAGDADAYDDASVAAGAESDY